MGAIRCDFCGGSVILNEDKKTATCEYCRSVILLPGVSTAGNDNQNSADIGTQELLDAITIHLRNKEWEMAKSLCNEAMITQPDNSWIYLYLMMIDYHCEKEEDLVQQVSDIDHNENYQKALLYADEQFKNQLISYNQQPADQTNQETYEKAISLSENRKDSGNLIQAYELFDQLGDYKDADLKKKECAMDIVKVHKESNRGCLVLTAMVVFIMLLFRFIPGIIIMSGLYIGAWNLSKEIIKEYQKRQNVVLYADEQFRDQVTSYNQQLDDRINQEIYEKAISLSENGEHENNLVQAYELFDQLRGYKDADLQKEECARKLIIIYKRDWWILCVLETICLLILLLFSFIPGIILSIVSLIGAYSYMKKNVKKYQNLT